jgi:capsular exopolysaccharide synthesis family protein
VSRIQDILAKAERDGTARRTHAEQTGAAALTATPASTGSMSSTAVLAPIDGTAALDTAAFMPRPMDMPGPIDMPVNLAELRPAPGRPELVETRTARATLHPALVAAIAPHSTVAEQYRAVRTRLNVHEDATALRTLVVTSPGAGDGKSITAANLALTMAQEHQRNVLLIDADVRRPSVHSLFGIDDGPGLADVLNGDATLDEALIYLPDHRLTLLTAGPAPQYPTELLGSTAMRRTLDTLRARFDRILLDVPAVAPLADVSTIAPLADGVLMVVRAGVTQRPALEAALGVFEENKVLGFVLNEAR